MEPVNRLKSSLADRYDIERELGVGGMATVYLARDLRHDRYVALKLLNPELGAVLGVERFLAEIKVTANLQHPNLLPLFDSGEVDGLLFYVMPYVEGETLRHRLDREKQLPVDEAIRISIAIANALDYAHKHGVIHRDLKPENILLQEGQPVVADFGIALAVSKAGGNRITQTGLSLGTPSYMSPEQATGDRVIDARSDIYSLGAMTYEMLTGEPPHIGNTSQAVIARMLTDKPRSIRSTRSAVPEYVEDAVLRALEKLPADRFSTVREYSEALQGRTSAGATSDARTSARRAAARPSITTRLRDPLVLGLAAASVAFLAFALLRGRSTPMPAVPTIRYVLSGPDSVRPVEGPPWPGAISPDGSTVAYLVQTAAGTMLYSRKSNQLDGRPIPGTVNATQILFSPDGEWIAFEVGGKLRKVRLDGSSPIAVADAGSVNGADWTTQDEFVLGSELNFSGLSRVSASGGELTEFAKPDKSKGELAYLWPIAEPDGKKVVFAVWKGDLASVELATATLDGEVLPLGLKGIRPLAVIGRTLVYVQSDGSVMGVALDRSGRHPDGRPTPVLDPVSVIQRNNGNSGIFVSRGGALVTSAGGALTQLNWSYPDGSIKPISSEFRQFGTPRLSRDGGRIAVTVTDRDQTGIWIHDIATGTFSRLTSVRGASAPAWMPDGKSILFLALGDRKRFAVWQQASDGGTPAKKLFDIDALTGGLTVSPDGRSILIIVYTKNSWQLYRASPDTGSKPVVYLSAGTLAVSPEFSPDGRWVALVTDESGHGEVYVRSFPDPSARVQVSTGIGDAPQWSRDGARIFYRAGAKQVVARLAMTPSLRVVGQDTIAQSIGAASGGTLVAGYQVANDGRFLILTTSKDNFALVVSPNWRTELEQRLAQSRKK